MVRTEADFAFDLVLSWTADSSTDSWRRLAEAEAQAEAYEDPDARRYMLEMVEDNRRHLAALDAAVAATTYEDAYASWQYVELLLARLIGRAREANRLNAEVIRSLVVGDRVVSDGRRRLAALLRSVDDQDSHPLDVPPADHGPPGQLVAATPHVTNGPPALRVGVAA